MSRTMVMVTGPSKWGPGHIHLRQGPGILGDRTLCGLEPYATTRPGRRTEVNCKKCLRKMSNG